MLRATKSVIVCVLLSATSVEAQELRDPFKSSNAPQAATRADVAKPADDPCAQARSVKDLIAEVTAVLPIAGQLDRRELSSELQESAQRWAQAAITAADQMLAEVKLPPPAAAVAPGSDAVPQKAQSENSPAAGAPPHETAKAAEPSLASSPNVPPAGVSPPVAQEPMSPGAPAPPASADAANAQSLQAQVQNRIERLGQQHSMLSQLCETQSAPKVLSVAERLNADLKTMSDSLNHPGAPAASSPAAESDREAQAEKRVRDLKALQATLARALATGDRMANPQPVPTPPPPPADSSASAPSKPPK